MKLYKVSKTIIMFFAVLILGLHLLTGITQVSAQDPLFSEITIIPTPQSPSGTIYDRTPTYVWSVVSGASDYRYRVYKVGSSQPLYTVTIGKNACGETTCSSTSVTRLELTAYKWQVQAKIGGIWKPYSVFMNFAEALGFDSQFNGSMAGWKTMGTVEMSVNSKYLNTGGYAGYWAQAYNVSASYSNFSYSSLMKRLYDTDSPNCLFIRMGISTGMAENYWYPGYAFCYKNHGRYAIIKRTSNSTYTMLQPWALTPAIEKMGWNTLKVVANGSNFKFYINGTLVKSFTDGFRNNGFVGIGMYDSGVSRDQIRIDWARLTVLSASYQDGDVVSLEQEALNNAAMENQFYGTYEGDFIE